jgi:hypothetical protein
VIGPGLWHVCGTAAGLALVVGAAVNNIDIRTGSVVYMGTRDANTFEWSLDPSK